MLTACEVVHLLGELNEMAQRREERIVQAGKDIRLPRCRKRLFKGRRQPVLSGDSAVRLLYTNDNLPGVQELQLFIPNIRPHTCRLRTMQILSQGGADGLPCLSGRSG